MSVNIDFKPVLRLLYKQIPFKRQLFVTIRKIYVPPQSLYQHFYFSGLFRTEVGNSSFVMANHNSKLETSVFWSGILGSYEQSSLRIWIELCKRANIIFDVGANTGVYSLVAKAINPRAQVYAFEPIVRIYNLLAKNCSDNQYDVQHFNYALSNCDGQGVIYDLKYQHHYHASLNRDEITYPDSDVVKRDVMIKRIDTFADEHRIEKIDLVKIDVEGREADVIAGFGTYLCSMLPTIILEIKSESKAHQIENLLKDKGYLYFDIDEERGPRLVEHLAQSSSWNYLLCTPEVARSLGLIDLD